MANELLLTFDGTPAFGLYAVIRRRSDMKAWNGSAFETWADGNIASYDVPLASQGGDVFAATMPAGIAADDYLVVYYELAGAAPAVSDLELRSRLIHWSGTAVTPVGSSYTGRYTSEAVLKQRFGSFNITAYSDTESAGVEDDAAIEEAIRWAEDQVDAFYAGSPYTVPFVATGAALPRTIREWATVLAGWWLYTKRGLDDQTDRAGGKLQKLRDSIEAEMVRYRGGHPFQLPGVQLRTNVALAVTIVEPRTNELSAGAELLPTDQRRDNPLV